jgi:hypothetical protein
MARPGGMTTGNAAAVKESIGGVKLGGAEECVYSPTGSYIGKGNVDFINGFSTS